MRTKFKAWTRPYLEEHQEYSLSEEELSLLDNIYLEIGSGKGDFLLQISQKFPDRYFLGVEKNITCAGISVKKFVDNKIENIKFLALDATEVIKLLKDQSVQILYLNFSDPWPKKRHAKRRLTSESFLQEYKRILKSDGQIIFKTDNVDLFDFTRENFKATGFQERSCQEDYDGEDPSDAQTEYERSFRNQGVKIKRVVFSI